MTEINHDLRIVYRPKHYKPGDEFWLKAELDENGGVFKTHAEVRSWLYYNRKSICAYNMGSMKKIPYTGKVHFETSKPMITDPETYARIRDEWIKEHGGADPDEKVDIKSLLADAHGKDRTSLVKDVAKPKRKKRKSAKKGKKK